MSRRDAAPPTLASSGARTPGPPTLAAVTATPEPLHGWRVTRAGGLLRAARPKQWLKNVLVFAAPGAAGVLTQARPLARAALAFVVFCVTASGVYFLNDAIDVEADRNHPKKYNRPIAAGIVGVRLAQVLGVVLIVAGLGLSTLLGWKLIVVMAVYVAVQFAYSLYLRHEPILDLAAVATGFVLRAIAGGVATRVPISEWFLIVAMFGSLFVVTGKRCAEHTALGEDRGAHRATLARYSLPFLRYVLALTSTVAVTAYCLWAFESQKAAKGGIWFQLSIVPFGLAVLRYAFLLDQGHGGAPEDVVIGDRALQLLGVAWMVIFALGVYG